MKNQMANALAKELTSKALSSLQPTEQAAPAAAVPVEASPPPPSAPDTPPAPPVPDAPIPQGPPPTPPPAQFNAEAIKNRFIQPPQAPAPATPPPPSGDLQIPETPPLTPEGQADPKAGHTWAKLRLQAVTGERQAREWQAKAEAAEERARVVAEEKAAVAAEKLESDRRIAELSEKVARLSLAESPEFIAKYDGRKAELASELSSALVKFAGVAPEQAGSEASRLLAVKPAELADMLTDLNPSVGGMIMAIANRAGSIEEARAQELANWRQSAAASGYANARKSVVESAEIRRQYADKALDWAIANGNPVYAATDPQAKERAAQIAQAFQGFAQTATEEQLIAAAAEGFSASQLYDVVNQLTSEVQELRDRLASRDRAANPPLYPMSPYAAPEPPPPVQPNVTPVAQRANPTDMIRGSLLQSLQSVRAAGG